MSIGDSAGSRDVGTSRRPASRAIAQIGTFTQNTLPQENHRRRSPPATGPSPMPIPAVPAQIAIARCRSRASGKMLVRIDNVAGNTRAAPTPVNARNAISSAVLTASAEAAEAAPNTTSPVASAPRRPNRSPSAPAVSRRPANTTVYPSTIHCSALEEARRLSTRVGSATLRIVVSTVTTTSERHNTPNAHHLRVSAAGSGIVSCIMKLTLEH